MTSRIALDGDTVGDNPSRFGVWTPATGKVRVLGDYSFLVATYTDGRGARSLVAWLPTCGTASNCPLQLTDAATGATRQINNPLGFGFDFGGAFSADGRQLAAFAKTNSGYSDPETRLALIDTVSGSLRLVPGATLGIGEAVAWAQWLNEPGKLMVGGLSGDDSGGTWQANHFLVDAASLHSTPFSFSGDRDLDVNYSAVVLP